MRSKRRERYSRNLEGLNAHGFYSPAAVPAYTAQPNIASFLVNALEGEIGVYTADGQTLLVAPPVVPETPVLIVQKQDDEIHRTQPFPYSDVKKVIKTPYDAPVIQETYVGYNTVDGSMNITIVGGLQEFVASARETTPANQPFPIQEGRAIVRSGTPTDYYIANRIVEDLLNDGDYEGNADIGFVRATVVTSAAGGAAVGGAVSILLTEGLNSILGDAPITGATVGDYLIIDGGTYQVREISGNYIILDRPYAGPSMTVLVAAVLTETAANVDAAEVGIRFRGYDELAMFEVSVSEDLAEATITTTVEWKQGSGAAWQVASMEDETSVFQGWTTLNEAWVNDFGKPTFFVDANSADEYSLFFLTNIGTILPSAGTPQNQTKMKYYTIIAPINGSALEASIETIFPPS